MEHLESNSLLRDLQHGFQHMSLRSCETQLLQFVDDLARGVCDGDQFDLAIMDFSKAFDIVHMHTYMLKGEPLAVVDRATYLGVSIFKDLGWQTQSPKFHEKQIEY